MHVRARLILLALASLSALALSAPLHAAQLGVGPYTALAPMTSTNGQQLVMPASATGIRFYLGSNCTITLTIQRTDPTSVPPTFTISAASGSTNWDENLFGQAVYLTSVTGSCGYRFY